jgi:hypothetical protein
MRPRNRAILTTLLLCTAATGAWADLAPYSEDFEGLAPAPQELPTTSLGENGWFVFGNVFNPDWSYRYGYGPFPAPNTGAAFSAVVGDAGESAQGTQQLSVFSDYNNGDHQFGRFIEANVFQERIIGAADVGSTWRFDFDAKRGNIGGSTTAKAFFKTLNPFAGYALTNFIWIDMTNVPDTWEDYSLSIYIDPSLVGQILQFGFLNTATNYEGSGILYDNVVFRLAPLEVGLDVKPGGCPNPINTRSRGDLPVAIVGAPDFDVTTIDVDSLRLEGVAPLRSDYEDVAAPFEGDLCGCTTVESDGFLDLTLSFDTQQIVQAVGSSSNEEVVLTLTGNLLDGTAIEGLDCALVFRPEAGGPAPLFRDRGVRQRVGSEAGTRPDVDDLQR